MYAKKDQEVAGYKFTKNGTCHNQGIDLTLDSRPVDGGGKTPVPIEANGRLNITTFMSPDLENWSRHYIQGEFGGNHDYGQVYDKSRTLLYATSALMHELFIHVDLWSKDWLDDGKLWDPSGPEDEHHPRAQASLYLYRMENYSSPANSWWPVAGFSVLQQTNARLNSRFTNGQLYDIMDSGIPNQYAILSFDGVYYMGNKQFDRTTLINLSTGKQKVTTKKVTTK